MTSMPELLQHQYEERQLLDTLMKQPSAENKAAWADCCQENLQRVHGYIAEHGWPNRDTFGGLVENAVFLMVQHGDARGLKGEENLQHATALQEELLATMQHDGASKGYVAFVTDRIRHNRGEPQLYGCVPDPFYPIEDKERVDQRRLDMGLKETLSEYHHRLSEGDKMPHRAVAEASFQPPGTTGMDNTAPCKKEGRRL